MLVIQDDCFSGVLHLDEILLSLVPTAVAGGGAFAFASRDGLSAIFGSEEFKKYYRQHTFDLIIGVDAVTDTSALKKAAELMAASKGRLHVRAYLSQRSHCIFHPKFVWFQNQSTLAGTTIVGSGNLTLSGLQNNIEAFCWDDGAGAAVEEVVRTWDRWVAECDSAGRLYDIADPCIRQKAQQNARRVMRVDSRADRASEEGGGIREAPLLHQGIGSDNASEEKKDIFICGIPRQTGRGWSQFNMPRKYFSEYFGFDPQKPGVNKSRRILIQSITEEGVLGEVESRAGVISSTSSNYRIELDGARKVLPLREGSNPYVLFHHVGARSYRYMIVAPDSPLFDSVLSFARRHDSEHRAGQLYRCTTSSDELFESIKSLPLAYGCSEMADADEQ